MSSMRERSPGLGQSQLLGGEGFRHERGIDVRERRLRKSRAGGRQARRDRVRSRSTGR